MTTRPVQVRVSQATRLAGSSRRQASRMASEIWSAILSGCPSVTDSEVNRKRFVAGKLVSPQGISSLYVRYRKAYRAQWLLTGVWLRVHQNGNRHCLPSATELADAGGS